MLDGVEQPAGPVFPGSARFEIIQSTNFNVIEFRFAERFVEGNPRSDGAVFRSMGLADGVIYDFATTQLNTESDRFRLLQENEQNLVLRFQRDASPMVPNIPAFDARVRATFALVPEPSTAILIGFGLVSLAARKES